MFKTSTSRGNMFLYSIAFDIKRGRRYNTIAIMVIYIAEATYQNAVPKGW